MWVYIQSEPNLYTVGFYDPAGTWHPDSDHETKDEAAKRAAFLNGSGSPLSPRFLAALQKAKLFYKEELEALGGCDHEVGICFCHEQADYEEFCAVIREVGIL